MKYNLNNPATAMIPSIPLPKAILIITLLLLISSRLSWLQTSSARVEVSPTVYRTGLVFSRGLSETCSQAPEATFPLPSWSAFDPQFSPPSLQDGQLSIGLLSGFWLQCQSGRLEIEKTANLNAWIFAIATFFCALATRALTKSWTLGLGAGVAILSRGTLQSQAMYVTADSYASMWVSIFICAMIFFVRTRWWPWMLVASLATSLAFAFLPELMMLNVVTIAALLFFVWNGMHPETNQHRSHIHHESSFWRSATVQTKLPALRPLQGFICALALLVSSLCFLWLEKLYGTPFDASTLRLFSLSEIGNFVMNHALWQVNSWRHLWRATNAIDMHALYAVVFFFVPLLIYRKLPADVVATSIIVICIFGSFVLTYYIGSAFAQRLPDRFISPSLTSLAKSLEPAVIGLNIALTWMVVRSFRRKA